MKITPKAARIYIAAAFLLVLAVLVFAQQAFNPTPFVSPSGPDEIFLVYTLSTAIFIVLVVFGFVLTRILVKVWLERKQLKPGAKFKTRLIVTMIALTLIPVTVSFVFGFGLINRSIMRWFDAPVDDVFTASNEISRQWRIARQRDAQSILNYFAVQPPTDLDWARENFRLKTLVLLSPSGEVLESAADRDGLDPGLAAQVLTAIGKQRDLYLETDSNVISARRVDTAKGETILVAVFPTPAGVARSTKAIDVARNNYDGLNKSRKQVRFTYVSVLLLMSVLALFAAVWVGLALSKRITVPIEALAEATREISAGNLDHRVSIQAADELGMLVTLFNDMAGRLQGTTRELEARRRYIEVILESIPTGVISLDADLRVNTLNRAAHTMFSVEKAAHLNQVFKGKDLETIQQLIAEAGNGSVTREIAFSTPGRPADSAVTASHLAMGGFVLVVEDLTEVARAQKASAWREVARRLAHEIKNPLTPIQLSAERIARNVSRLPATTPRLAALINECVDAIVGEVAGLKNLVDEFVRFARLPAVERAPNSMRELVDKTLALYDGRMDGVDLTVNVPEDLPPVLMDSLQMKRVLINLLDNALNALSETPPGDGSKELRITCELARDSTMARLTIEDSGCGIAPEDRERLFTPYFSTRASGTGLGLAIASRIVADHGGYIGAEPRSQRGTRFVVELPVCPESSLSTTNRVSVSN